MVGWIIGGAGILAFSSIASFVYLGTKDIEEAGICGTLCGMLVMYGVAMGCLGIDHSTDLLTESCIDDEKIATIIALDPNELEIKLGERNFSCQVYQGTELIAPMARRRKTILAWNKIQEDKIKEDKEKAVENNYQKKLDSIIKKHLEQE